MLRGEGERLAKKRFKYSWLKLIYFVFLCAIFNNMEVTSPRRHYIMASVHTKNTKPEVLLRQMLWCLGFRYRVNAKNLPGSPDIVLPKYHTVIFVHGCFWHGHKGCKYYTVPKTNTEFWVAKVARNQERDQEVWRKLEAKGWSVIIVWECELKKGRIDETVERVAAEIRQNGDEFHAAQEERRRAREKYLKEQKTRREKESLLMEEIVVRRPSRHPEL